MPKPPKPLVRPVRMEGGVLCLSDGSTRGEAQARKLLAAALKHLPDGPYTWKLEPYAETRRVEFNNFYWAFLTAWSEENGHTKDELHDICKMRHNSKVIETVDPKTGEAIEMRVPQSTAKLTQEQFRDYVTLCEIDAAEWNGFVFSERKPEGWTGRRKEMAA